MDRLAVLKEPVIPNKEYVYRPDLTAVVRLFIYILSVFMIIQHLQEKIRTEKALCRIRLEHLPDFTVILILFQPDTDRDREAELLLFRRLSPDITLRRCSERDLRLRRPHFILQRKRLCKLQHLLVKERDAHLQ